MAHNMEKYKDWRRRNLHWRQSSSNLVDQLYDLEGILFVKNWTLVVLLYWLQRSGKLIFPTFPWNLCSL